MKRKRRLKRVLLIEFRRFNGLYVVYWRYKHKHKLHPLYVTKNRKNAVDFCKALINQGFAVDYKFKSELT